MLVKRHLIGLLAGSLLSAGCAAPPLEEQQAAHYLVGQAYRLQAEQLAPEAYRNARAALEAGDAAMRVKDYDAARATYVGARYHASAAAYRARQEARSLDDLLRDRPPAGQADLPATAKAWNRLTRPEPSPVKDVVPPPVRQPAKPRMPKLVDQITVRPGESLFTIAAAGEVYDDPLLWPLLYQANRDQIKDPRQIFPGQELSVPRNVTDAELERARTIARQSTIFPVE